MDTPLKVTENHNRTHAVDALGCPIIQLPPAPPSPPEPDLPPQKPGEPFQPVWERLAAAKAAKAAKGQPEAESPQEAKETAKESILQEALRITAKARQGNYGPAGVNHARIARLWQAFLDNRRYPDNPLSPEEVVELMILLKIARLQHCMHRDSAVDIAGYSSCLERIVEENGDIL
jgi:hypothetical protein